MALKTCAATAQICRPTSASKRATLALDGESEYQETTNTGSRRARERLAAAQILAAKATAFFPWQKRSQSHVQGRCECLRASLPQGGRWSRNASRKRSSRVRLRERDRAARLVCTTTQMYLCHPLIEKIYLTVHSQAVTTNDHCAPGERLPEAKEKGYRGFESKS